MMMQRIKQKAAIVLAAALVCTAALLPNAQAAIGVDAGKTDCSVEVDVTGAGFSELMTLPITVNLYKVAFIDVTGEYTSAAAFDTLDFTDLSAVTTAQEWETYAADAKAIVDGGAPEITATTDTEVGVAVIENLETGLYLVDAQQVVSDYYQYDFAPYLISLPNNYYYSTGSDDWVYELTGDHAIGLKPEKTDRLGDLLITKDLDVYNETNTEGTFVFQIEAVKTDIDTNERKVVYSDVVAMTFTSAGSDSILIEDLPAGAVVTVTEIYTGANYKLVSDPSVTVTIIPDDEEGAPAEAEFKNTHDGSHDGGYGLVNHFAYDAESGEWTHSVPGMEQ